MELNKAKSISYRLSISIIFLSVIFTFAAFTVHILSDYYLIINNKEKNLIISKNLTKEISKAVWIADIDKVKELTNRIGNFSYFDKVRLDSDVLNYGVGILREKEDYKKHDIKITMIKNNTLVYIGNFTIYERLVRFDEYFKDKISSTLIYEIVEIFLMSIFVLLLIRVVITKRLKKIADYTSSLSRSNLSVPLYIKRIPFFDSGNSEFIKLADSINRMRQNLESDIDAIKKAELEINTLYSEKQLIINSTGEAIVGLNKDGNIMYVNRALKEITGYSEEEIIGQNHHEIFHSNIKHFSGEDECLACKTLKDGKRRTYRDKFFIKDGKEIFVEVVASPIIKDWNIEGVVLSYYDITDKVEAEENLRLSNEHLKGIFEADLVGMAALDSDARFVAANDRFCQILGINRNNLIGSTYFDIDHDDMQSDLGVFKKIRENILDYSSYEKKYTRKDGEVFHLQVGLRCLRDLKGEITHMYITFNDITEVKTVQNELIKKSDELKEINAVLEERVIKETNSRIKQEQMMFEQKKFADMGQMVNAIAHQWRQPLNALGLYVQVIDQSYRDKVLDDDMVEDFSTSSFKLIKHMSRTIDDFRSFFDPKTEEEEFDVLIAITETMSLVEAQIKNHDIYYEIKCNFAEGRIISSITDNNDVYIDDNDSNVKGYLSEFKQVIMNLIQNAKDAIIEQGTEGKIEISIVNFADKVNVYIRDNGGGIPEDILSNVFDPYFTTKEEGKGTGIGLYISKLIIEEHLGGKISVANVNKGAEFTITLNRLIK